MILLSTIIDKISTLKDGSLKITLESQELNSAEMAVLFELRNKQVYTAFKETPIKADELDIKEPLTEFKNDKSPSQRLRAVLYCYWEQHKPTKDFDAFYKAKIEEFINLVKDKLN
jgi:hypothetical protein